MSWRYIFSCFWSLNFNITGWIKFKDPTEFLNHKQIDIQMFCTYIYVCVDIYLEREKEGGGGWTWNGRLISMSIVLGRGSGGAGGRHRLREADHRLRWVICNPLERSIVRRWWWWLIRLLLMMMPVTILSFFAHSFSQNYQNKNLNLYAIKKEKKIIYLGFYFL